MNQEEPPLMDHDQRFKNLIREFFSDFMHLFFEKWAARFDLDSIEWLDKEVFPDPPEGARRQLDLVGKLRTKERVEPTHGEVPENWLALIHIEIESPDRTTIVKPRLPFYYVSLRERHGLPVLPIVLYLKVGLEGIGIDTYTEQFWELQALTFNYLYVGLPGLDAVQYVQGDNWLGVALTALMKIPAEQVVWLGAEAIRRVVGSPLSEQKRYLLAECIEAYRNLNEEQRSEYEKLLLGSAYTGVKAMNKTTYEKGVEKGKELILFRLGQKKFGPMTTEVESHIRSIQNPAKLDYLIDRILDVGSWEELLAP